MIEEVAASLFRAKGAADRVIAAVMTKDRAHMHLDTVFTMLDRDKVTAYARGRRRDPAPISLRPGSNGQAPSTSLPRGVVPRVRRPSDGRGPPAGGVSPHLVGTAYQQEREEWDDGNNVVALEPGVVVRPTSGTPTPSTRCARQESR